MSQGMHINMSQIDEPREDETGPRPEEDELIPRGETGFRILLSVLFVLIGSVLETVLGVVVIFQLIVALSTQRPPSLRVREFANRIISYYYKLGRYVTYNESRVPFPFSDFPRALEPDRWIQDETESKALGIPAREFEPDDEEEDPYEDDELR